MAAASPSLWGTMLEAWTAMRFAFEGLEPQLIRQMSAVVKQISWDRHPILEDKPSVLVLGFRQNNLHMLVNWIIGMALRLRGHPCEFIGCDRAIRAACNHGHFPHGTTVPTGQCRACYRYAEGFYASCGMHVSWLSEFMPPGVDEKATAIVEHLSPEEFSGLEHGGIQIGEIVKTSVTHFLRTDDFEIAPEWKVVYRNFLIGAIAMIDACQNMLSAKHPDIVLLMNGRFMPGRIMYELAKRTGIKIIAYEEGLVGGTYHFYQNRLLDYDVEKYWHEYRQEPLTPQEEEKLDSYLSRRWKGLGFQQEYWPSITSDSEEIRGELGLRKRLGTAVLFPNIPWDSALFGRDIAFEGMMDWIDNTIGFFLNRQDLQLIIRSHPAEVTLDGANRDPIRARISRRFSRLPPNIKFVAADSDFSSYSLMEISDVALVYTSTTGLEMALLNKPAIVSGKVHYRAKGFTLDVGSKSEYIPLLSGILDSQETMADYSSLARKYAYMVLFRTSIPVGYVRLEPGKAPILELNGYRELLPGQNLIIDHLCKEIEGEGRFVLFRGMA